MKYKEQLTELLKINPQWIFVGGEWVYTPLSLFNCFCSIEDETDPIRKKLQVLLNETPRVLVLHSNPKKYYSQNLLNMLIPNFEGKDSDNICNLIKQENNWSSLATISIGRLNPIYESIREFTAHFESLVDLYNPTHVIFGEQIHFDSMLYSDEATKFTSQDIEELYLKIQDILGIRNVSKLITPSYFYTIPYEQMLKDDFLLNVFSTQRIINPITCEIKKKRNFKDKGEFNISYYKGKSYNNRVLEFSFKISCSHQGKMKLIS